MTLEAPEAMSWLVPGTLGLVFLGLGSAAWWLLRQRRRNEMRRELAEDLARSVHRLGLDTVWQAPLFQADVFGIRGVVDDFDVRAELWDKSTHEFFRLSIHFPQSMRQDFRIRAGKLLGMEKLWRLTSVELNDRRFDEKFEVYCHPEADDQVAEVLTAKVRRLLLDVVDEVDGIKIGDHSLYLYVDEGVEVDVVERIIGGALRASMELYRRARQVGPTRSAEEMAYERVSMDVLGREGGDQQADEMPCGTGAFESITGPVPKVGGQQEESDVEEDAEEAPQSGGASLRDADSEGEDSSLDTEGSAEEESEVSDESDSFDSSEESLKSGQPVSSFPAIDPSSVVEDSNSDESSPGDEDSTSRDSEG